jgi:hypothetical protein
MSKPKSKKPAKSDDQPKTKESTEEKKGEKNGDADAKQPQPADQWSDWIWDEEMKLYYRAKLVNGGEQPLA